MQTNIHGICQLALIPMRLEPSEKSEQVNQVLFGETFSIIESNENWCLIETHFDQYKGWITSKMATLIENNLDFKNKTAILKDVIGRISFPGPPALYQWIPGGSVLYEDVSGFNNFNESFSFDPVCKFHTEHSKIDITGTALQFINAPYLWGGRTVFGIDCSGFTQNVFKMNGIYIKRDASQQSEQGETVSTNEEFKNGDLAFFDNDEGRIVHVGIILDNNRIIHASGQVRIDKLDHQGIYNEDLKKYTHKLRLIRRMISEY